MNRRTYYLLIALLQAILAMGTQAAVLRTQTIQLRKGWNAVALEVQPGAARPSEIFASLPVELAACFIAGRAGEEFLRNPGDAPWKEEGWAVWYAPSRPEAVLSNLAEVQAYRPLLLLASADATWTVTGAVRARAIEWQADTCTFTTLPVDPAGGPTFKEFFSASPAHQRLRVFRLESGNWKLVRDPAVERARSGEAYWIHTDGTSTYQGPLQVSLPAAGELAFDLRGSGRELRLANLGSTPARVRVESLGGDSALPLRLARRIPSQLRTDRSILPSVLDLPALDAGTETSIRIEPDRERMRSTEASVLLRITDGRGLQLWVPASARRSLLPLPPSTSAAAASTH